jgi:hypothetical protein
MAVTHGKVKVPTKDYPITVLQTKSGAGNTFKRDKKKCVEGENANKRDPFHSLFL